MSGGLETGLEMPEYLLGLNMGLESAWWSGHGPEKGSKSWRACTWAL
jgi:hypothetical protein